ncbi:MAG: protein-disulfide reductase DsbD, partial [Gammaproteobacteria bacterium]
MAAERPRERGRAPIRRLGGRPGRWGAGALLALAAFLAAGTPAGTALAGMGFAGPGTQGQDLLPPERAFAFSARPLQADMLRLRWEVAPGYYLYKDKLRFRLKGAEAGEPLLPPPTEVKEDRFFGKMPVYRGELVVDLPVLRGQPDRPLPVSLEVSYQGCADAGVCFPPQTRKVGLTLPPVEGPTAAVGEGGEARGGLLGRLAARLGLGGRREQGFLPPERAFVFTAEASPDGQAVLARWQAAEGYYLYRDKLSLRLEDPSGQARLAPLRLPPGKEKVDEAFGRSEVYYGTLSLRVPVLRGAPERELPVTLVARYQGCADAGLCYNPQTVRLRLVLPPVSAAAGPTGGSGWLDALLTEQGRFTATLAEGRLGWILLSFYGVGLLLAFTPCVFPMIPILSSLIVGQAGGGAQAGERALGTGRALALSGAYVLAMALTYTAAGVVAGLFGANLQAALQTPWVIGAFAGLFVLLALSMFGLYQLQLPTAWQSRLSELSGRARGGSLAGAALMGALSALIVGPCLAAPLAGALLYIGQSGDAVLGGTALFAMALGMGTPLLAVGASAGRWLPRAGAWMERIKLLFGYLLLGLAVWMLSRILPGPATLALWGLLVGAAALHLA